MNETTEEVIGAAEKAITSVFDVSGNFAGLKEVFTWDFLFRALTIVTALALLYITYRVILKIYRRVAKEKLKIQTALLIEKGIKYTFYVLIALYVLDIFGVNLDALLGAAGILGVAIGFASQTSVSNIISGFFVLSENTIKIGDFVTIEDVVGNVHSIDLLSVKILTTDNQLIRVPNETIIKANLKNTTYYPVRRVQVRLSVSYDTDLELAYETLMKVPSMCDLVVDDPESAVFFDGFGASGIDIVLGAWIKKEDYIPAKNQLYIAVKKVYDEAKIEIPFAQIVIHDGDKVPSKVPAKAPVKTVIQKKEITKTPVKKIAQKQPVEKKLTKTKA